MASIIVRHNIEVAHRLFDLKGKCEAIHGHSMMVHLVIEGQVDTSGLLDGLEFGQVKKVFRGYLDETYDHHLLLNERDPWAGKLALAGQINYPESTPVSLLPGLQIVKGDPTTENISRWIARWAADTFDRPVEVTVEETLVNAASSAARPKNGN